MSSILCKIANFPSFRSLLTKIMVDQNVINPKDVKGISKSKKDSQDPGSNLTDNPPSTPKSSHKDGGNSRKRRESSSPSTSQQASKKRHVSNKDPSTDQGLYHRVTIILY